MQYGVAVPLGGRRGHACRPRRRAGLHAAFTPRLARMIPCFPSTPTPAGETTSGDQAAASRRCPSPTTKGPSPEDPLFAADGKDGVEAPVATRCISERRQMRTPTVALRPGERSCAC